VTRSKDLLRALLVPLIFVLLSCIFVQQAVAEVGRDVSKLDVSIAVFDPGVPADPSLHRDLDVFPRIRKIESLFLPFILRETLVEMNEWGAIRVVPEPDAAAELLVTGTIVRSDGDILELWIRVADASGRIWVEKSYAGIVSDDYAHKNAEAGMSSYQALYDEIAADLLAARTQLDEMALAGIVEVSLLRYAGELAPSAFGDYVTNAPDGTLTVNRLPAKGDPMFDRIALVRSTEYVITDAVDTKFRELHTEIASVYDVWRKYRRKSVQYQVEDARRAQDNGSDGERGSYEAIKNRYDNYKWHRITEREQDTLAVAFNNEVGPRVDAMELRVEELLAWVEQKHDEWHRILEGLFEVETGLAQ